MSLLEDARNIQRKDPAARSVLEVILLYPGFHILVYHRIAHWLYEHKHFFLARWVSQHGRHKTGIEIHPGARIGKCLFIDHGMGIVFGETTEIGDNCTIYHGVTLGGTGKDTGKRHPTLGDNVLIGAGTKVLGPVYIGDNARIGAGSVVLKNLPANCTAVGVPAEVVRINNKAVNPADDLDQQDLPDVVAQRLTELDRRIGALENAAQGDVPPASTRSSRNNSSLNRKTRRTTVQWVFFVLSAALLAEFLHFLRSRGHQLADGLIRHPHHDVLAVVDGHQYTGRRALADSRCHGRGDLPQQGIRNDDADGPHDDVGIAAVHHHGVLAGGSPGSPGFEHGRSRHAVGAHRREPDPGAGPGNGGHQLTAQSAALPINDKDIHQKSISSRRSRARM